MRKILRVLPVFALLAITACSDPTLPRLPDSGEPTDSVPDDDFALLDSSTRQALAPGDLA